MTAEEEAALRAEHRSVYRQPEAEFDARGEVEKGIDLTWVCRKDRHKWPCSTKRLLATLDAARTDSLDVTALRQIADEMAEDARDWNSGTLEDYGKRIDAVLEAARTDSLDVAWADAEAALPEGWRFSITPYWPNGYEVEAHDITRPYTPGISRYGTGTTGPYDTPAAALDALRTALSKEEPKP